MSGESASGESASTERTLTILREAQVYKLPPRPSAGGWRCQDWPKTNWIFTGRVRIVANGPQALIRLENPTDNSLFAQCPLNNDQPELSVEPVSDSSRYFVLRVTSGERAAFLGMGFIERNDAFDFNVTLQDHVKHARLEAELPPEGAELPPAGPSKDFTLKGNVSIALPAGHAPKPRQAAKPAAASGSISALLPPPPPGGGGGRRPVAAACVPAASAAAAPAPPAPAAASAGVDAFGMASFDPSADAGWATFD